MKSTNTTKLGIIGTVGVPACYGGFETLTHHLVLNLNKELDITVYCSGKTYPREEQVPEWEGAKLKYIPLQANGLQSIFYDLWSILHAVKNMDVLLVLGVSGCLFLPFIKLFTKKKIIVNIDGLEWRRPKWNKYAKRFLLLSERIACLYADEIITDNRILKEYVKIRYNIEGNLIEYGADHVSKVIAMPRRNTEYTFLGSDYAFKVARIEPENNLHVILEAFAENNELPLVIVGNWANSDYGKNLKIYYSEYDHIHLLDPIYDSNKLNLLRSNAKVYVHGHSAGGTNPSLVEAMYLGLPILSFDVIYNRVTTNNECIYFETKEELSNLIGNLDDLPLRSVARKMLKYALHKYTWSFISEKYKSVVIGQEAKSLLETRRVLEKIVQLKEARAAERSKVASLHSRDAIIAKEIRA